MSRWRPPSEKSLPYITPQGFDAINKELEALWKKRRIVNNALAAAAAEGDRSENAEYIYRKKEQAGIDRRIRYLQKRIPELKVIEHVGDASKIFFGARITLEQEDGSEVSYRIVGADEMDTRSGDISIDSPLAKALLKKQAGDEITIFINGDSRQYSVLSIAYAEL